MGRNSILRSGICALFTALLFMGLFTVPAFAMIPPADPPSPPSAPADSSDGSDRDGESAAIADRYKLKTITVNGRQLEGFDKDILDYTYYMPTEEEAALIADLQKAVTGTPINIQAEVIESREGNTVRLYVNVDDAPGGLTYTVTFLKMVSTEGAGLIIRENRYLDEIIKGRIAANELKNRAVDSLKAITAEVKGIREPAEAEKAYNELQGTLTALVPIVEKTKSDQELIQGISDMTDAARNLVRLISDSDRTADLTVGYFGKMSSIVKKGDMESAGGSRLKNSVHALAREAVHSTGTLKARGGQVAATGEKAAVSFSAADIAGHLVKSKAHFSKIASALSNLLGSNNPRRLEYWVTLKADRAKDITAMNITVARGILESLSKDGVEKAELQIGEAALAVKPGILSPEEKILIFAASYASPADLKLPGGTGIVPGSLVADISLSSDIGSKESFDMPALLTMDLSGADISGYSEKNKRVLGLYRLNEESGNWMAVGGNYDPITSVIKVFRLHLSKYTVLKTDKTFSDVQNSWAKDDINELLNKGVVKETVAFVPKGELTREDFARWVAKAYGLEAGSKALPFKDVSKNHPYYNELAAAYSQGIINGRSSSAFDPNGKITRQEMATLITNVLVRYEKAKLDSSLSGKLITYPDNRKVAAWARDSVALVNELGIMQGDSRGFRPTDYISREEAASLFKRIYN